MKHGSDFLRKRLAVMLLMLGFHFMVFSQDLTVRITGPANRSHFDPCTDITVTAEAMAGSGGIDKVEFYKNGDLARSDTREPYDLAMKNVPDGLYQFIAKVIDDSGHEALSDPIIIYVGSAQDGNMVINGEFNCSVSPWRLDQYEGAVASIELWPDAFVTEDSSAAHIEITEVGAQFWGVQLMQPFKLLSGHTYEVSFVAETFDDKDIQVTFSMDYDPYATHKYWDIKLLSGIATYGPYTWECPIDDPKVMFKFVIGGNLIPMTLDAVQVIDKQWVGVKSGAERLTDFLLYQNYPNPFNPDTAIRYTLKKDADVKLTIYSSAGNPVASFQEFKPAGTHTVRWNGRDKWQQPVQSGIYIYRLETGGLSLSRKMLLLK
jgi:hypothetical protein